MMTDECLQAHFEWAKKIAHDNLNTIELTETDIRQLGRIPFEAGWKAAEHYFSNSKTSTIQLPDETM